MGARDEDEDAARRRHFGDFYDGPADAAASDPVGVVLGNCQAESLRIALDGCGVRLVRTPAIHELVAADVGPLRRLLRRSAVVVSQPVRDDYHGLPIGTRQLLAVAADAAHAIVPVVRFTGLHPTQAIVRPPGDAGASPPIVPYHDLRTLSEAAGRGGGLDRPLTVEAVRAEAAASIASLREREVRHGTVGISDVLEQPTFAHMRTINHPGNVVVEELARRVAATLDLPGTPVPVGRPLLDGIHAPRSRVVREAFGLEEAEREHWVVAGAPVEVAEVHAAQLAWYATRPEVVAAGLERHRDALDRLGL